MRERNAVTELISTTLSDLETRGYAVATSPYRLTARGQNARLTGLSAPSVYRLERAIERGRDGWLQNLVGLRLISHDLATQIARLVYESVEVAEKSLWLRRAGSSESAKYEALMRFTGGDDRFSLSNDYSSEIELLSQWIIGSSFVEIARMAPVYENQNSLFGGTNEPKRTSDATEHIGRLTYPASWAWAGVRVLAGDLGESIPGFIRSAIEQGLPSEAATQLVAQAHVTRSAALAVTGITGPDWNAVIEWIGQFEDELPNLGLTALDAERLAEFKDRLTSAEAYR
jgi:hypothetical protein